MTKIKLFGKKHSLQSITVLISFTLLVLLLLASIISNKANQNTIANNARAANTGKYCTGSVGTCTSKASCVKKGGSIVGGYTCIGSYVCCSVNSAQITLMPSISLLNDKRVFITSKKYNGNLGGLKGADAKCQSHANDANLGGIWKAWLSDSSTSASSRLNHHSGPYVRTDGVLIADGWADLTDGVIANTINLDEFATPYYSSMFYAKVWTNTNPDGSRNSIYANCKNWTSSNANDGNAVGGIFSYTDSQWSRDGSDICATSNTNRLYCIEQ